MLFMIKCKMYVIYLKYNNTKQIGITYTNYNYLISKIN
ncbi:Protein of unknown function [Gryllus bimaculatus]|nr:Protein of unknown function [Gryllus bimaculatus]